MSPCVQFRNAPLLMLNPQGEGVLSKASGIDGVDGKVDDGVSCGGVHEADDDGGRQLKAWLSWVGPDNLRSSLATIELRRSAFQTGIGTMERRLRHDQGHRPHRTDGRKTQSAAWRKDLLRIYDPRRTPAAVHPLRQPIPPRPRGQLRHLRIPRRARPEDQIALEKAVSFGK
jgi:hypothetical protein